MKTIRTLSFWFAYVFLIGMNALYGKTNSGDSPVDFSPQINVLSFDMITAIVNGDNSPDLTDGTLIPSVNIGETGMTVFYIQNVGSSDLNISNISFSGTHASDFSVQGTSPSLITIGGQEQLTIVYTPSSAGTATATINITSDDPITGTYSFDLQSEGIEKGNALSFDGVDDYIAFSFGDNFGVTNNFTLSTWIKLSSYPTSKSVILSKTNDSTEGYEFYINSFGDPTFDYYTMSGINTVSADTNINLNQWYKLTITFDGADAKFYVDKNLTNTVSESESIQISTHAARIGWDNSGTSGEAFHGSIDDVQVYNRVLSICEVDAIFDCQVEGSTNELVAYYTFFNGSPGADNTTPFPINIVNDVQSNLTVNDGTLTNFALNGATSNWVDGSNSNVSGTCSTYQESELSVEGLGETISDEDSTPNTTDGTDFGDIDISSVGLESTFSLKNLGSANLNISNIAISGTNASDFSVTSSISLVVNASSNQDLTIQFSPTTVGVKTATVTITSDDCDGSYTFDIQGNGIISATGLNFDGTDDHIEVSHNTAFNVSAFTIQGYFKTSSTISDQAIMGKYDTANSNGFSVHLSDTGFLRLAYAVSNVSTHNRSSIDGLNDGNWHHFSIVFGNNKTLYYIDGTLDNQIDISTNANAPSNTEKLFIGYSAFTSTYFDGDLDEIRYWSRVICEDELTDIRTCQLTGNESNLVTYYDFNQGAVDNDNSVFTSLPDATSNNLDGTLLNFGLTGGASNWINASGNNVSGTCSITVPEINIQGDGNDITSGDTTPSTSDNTDAGDVNEGSSENMTFFVRNTDGTADLNISSVTLSGDTDVFTLTQDPSGNPLGAGESATLRFNFAPTAHGVKTATVTINSDDCDEPVYTFTIQGKGIGQASGLDFDGSNDIVTISHDNSQNSLDFSVDFWIKTTDGLGGVVNKFTVDGNNGWRINLDGGRVEFYYFSSASNYTTRLLGPETIVNDGNWHHVAITLDSGNARCYIDGTEVKSTGWNGTPTVTTTTANIQLGYAAADTPSGDTGGYFEGQLDELRIWTKTLTAFEISQLNGCTMDASQSGLIASYNFNQGTIEADNSSETSLTDGSGNSFNGTLSNFALSGTSSNWIDAADNNVEGSCDCIVAGNVTLTTQTEVDNFITDLSTCKVIEGNVTINGTITDLSGFSDVHTISGDFHLEGNVVNDLSGFTSLTTIGGDFILKDMTNITSLSSFSNITSLGGNFEVENLDLLTDLPILSTVTSISKVEITGNALLSTISFSLLETISSDFKLTFNGSLSSLSVPKLDNVSGELRMNNNGSAMTSLTFSLLTNVGNFLIADVNGIQSISFPELSTITSNLSVNSCASLTTFSAPKATSISGYLFMEDCESLNSIDLSTLSSIGNYLTLDNLGITSLSFLQSLNSISNTFLLRDLTSLTNLTGVNSLTTMGSFSMTNCDLVSNLEGFTGLSITSIDFFNLDSNDSLLTLDNSFVESLTSIGEFTVSFNTSIAEINALQNVISLTNSNNSTIRENNSLQSVNMYALRNVTANLIIRDQEQGIISLCGLYEYVNSGDGGTTLSFQNSNQTNWDSAQDILDNCDPSTLFTWTGTSGSTWSVNGNWNGSSIPSTSTNVLVPNVSNTPSIDSGVAIEINDITVETSASFTINGTGSLEVNGDFSNSGDFVLNSSSSNSSSLIVKGTSSGEVTYNRGGLLANQWSIITAPVAGQTIKDFVENAANDIRINTSVTPNRYAVAYYDDSQASGSKWIYYDVDFLTANPNTTFEIGRSYAFSRATSGVLTFTGTLTVDNTAKTVTANQWNAIGNPFTAFVPTNQNSNNNFISDNTANFDPTNIAVYLWDNTQNKYVARSLVDATQTSLPPGQGFFIRTNTGVTSVNFNKDQRMTQPATGNTNFGRSSTPSIQLFVERDGTKVDTQIKYYPTATKGLDPGYDIGNFGGTEFDIYTHLLEDSTGQEFTIQSLPDSDYQNMPIPIGVKATSGNLITFSATVSNIPEGIEVVLEDTITGDFTRLDVTDASYTITLDEDINDTSRFVLHTKASTLSTQGVIKKDINLFVTDQRVLKISGLLGTKASIKLYDILGKEILSRNMDVQNSTEVLLPNSLQKAIYIVKLQAENGNITQKIILQ